MPQVQRVKWASGQRGDFTRWFQRTLENTIGDRQALERTWKDHIVRWRAKVSDVEVDFPFPGASNLELPLTAMHADPVYADFMQTLHAGREFWHVQPKRADRVDHANAIRELLARLDQDYLHMRDINRVAFLYNVVLGTGIYKHTWVDESRVVRDYNEVGEIEDRLKRDSFPRIQHVPLHYFYIPANAWEIDPDAPVGGARWVAEKFYLTAAQLRARARGNPEIFPTYDKTAVDFVLNHEFGEDERTSRNRANEEIIDTKIRAEDEYQPFEDNRIELFEVWARWDVNNDGIDEDVVLIWHHETETILRATHNPFMHGQRPYEAIRYLQGFGFYGIGLAEIDEWAQNATTKLLNAQVDNVLLANTRMISAPEGTDIQPGEPLYPGRVFTTPPGGEVRALQLGDIYQSLPQVQQQILQLSEQRTAVPELRQGDISQLPSRTPASSLLSIMKEGNKRFDEILSTMRGPLGRLGMRTLQNLAQWMREDPVRWQNYMEQVLGPEDAFLVQEVLTVGVTELGEQFGVEVSAVSSLSNKETEKQNFLALAQTLQQMGGATLQLAQVAEQMAQSASGQVAAALYRGNVELIKEILRRFEIQNAQEFLPPDVLPFDQTAGGAGAAGLPGDAAAQFGALGGPQAAAPFAQGPDVLAGLLGAAI